MFPRTGPDQRTLQGWNEERFKEDTIELGHGLVFQPHPWWAEGQISRQGYRSVKESLFEVWWIRWRCPGLL